MAGNQEIYQQSLQNAAAHADAKQWMEAVTDYQKALAEFPDDEDTWSKIADALERIGRLDAAARAYASIAELRLRGRDLDTATDIWTRAARLDPNNTTVQRRLAQVYQHQGQTKLAIRAYLALARIHQKNDDMPGALAQLQTASKLDPDDPDILKAMELLRGAEPEPPPPPRKLDTSIWDLQIESGDEDDLRGSPIEAAREIALSELAGTLFDDTVAQSTTHRLSKAEVDALISDGTLQGGMLPKIDAALDAAKSGVNARSNSRR